MEEDEKAENEEVVADNEESEEAVDGEKEEGADGDVEAAEKEDIEDGDDEDEEEELDTNQLAWEALEVSVGQIMLILLCILPIENRG